MEIIMDCPVCKTAMITFELEGVEVDFCNDCNGIWLDAGELEQLLGNPLQAEQLINSFKVDKNCSEKPRKCPICLKKMKKIIINISEPLLLIDKCAKSHGLWFDKGELQDILKTGSFDSENKVAKLLTEMFAD